MPSFVKTPGELTGADAKVKDAGAFSRHDFACDGVEHLPVAVEREFLFVYMVIVVLSPSSNTETSVMANAFFEK